MTSGVLDVVLFADQIWDADVPTNRQQIAARLPAHLDCRVLYVEPPSFALSPLFGAGRETGSRFHFASGRRARVSVSVQRVSDSVHIVSPLLPIPHRYAKRWPELVFASVRWFVRRATARLGFGTPLVWSYSPFGTRYLPDSVDPIGFVYDCVDRYDQLTYYTDYEVDIADEQSRTLAASDVVFVSSDPLYERFAEVHPTVTLTGNAADIGLFRTARPGGTATAAPEVRDVSGTVAGFYGVLSEYKLNFDLLERLVDDIPGLTLVLVGPAKADLPAWVGERADVIRVGRQPQHELPTYLTAFDVCLLPYEVNEYTEGVEPLKLYEYLAAEKPVVATPFAELPDLGDWLRIAPAGKPFVDSLRVATETRPESPPPDLRENDWSTKVEKMLSVLTDEGLVSDSPGTDGD